MNLFALFISHQQIDRVYRGARCQQFIDEHWNEKKNFDKIQITLSGMPD